MQSYMGAYTGFSADLRIPIGSGGKENLHPKEASANVMFRKLGSSLPRAEIAEHHLEAIDQLMK